VHDQPFSQCHASAQHEPKPARRVPSLIDVLLSRLLNLPGFHQRELAAR
jgi:hypothetical protein